MSRGLDSVSDLSFKAPELVKLGYTWAARYLFEPGSSSFKHELTASEARALTDAGMSIVTVWESGSPTTSAYFSQGKGTRAATEATRLAKEVGQPADTPIYFATDYDAKPPDVMEYFKEINAVMSANDYAVGCYGSGLVLQYLRSRGLITFEWLAQSHGWSGYLAEASVASIVQQRETTVLARDVDLDMTTGKGGGWRLPKKQEAAK